MGREIVVVWAGRHRRDAWESLCADYRKRVGRYSPVRDLPVKAVGGADDDARQRIEGQRLLAAAPDPSWTVALDRRGEALSSTALSRRLRELRDRWPHPIAFLLGSDLGHGDELLSTCRWKLSFGPITLPHELARLVLYEQLYRALSLDAGINYHRP
ncbi:MAG: 23S rRNA (pseudouridine(1915)-N(3))-methyltransferase RlmH [Acidobacteriota bacterium]